MQTLYPAIDHSILFPSHSFPLHMECPVCVKSSSYDDCIQFIPCLHIICRKCFDTIGKYAKTCPFPHCFSPLRLQPDMRMTKCESPTCRRRIAPVGESFVLECEHTICGECNGELFRGRRTAFCPECDAPIPGEGEQVCDVCTKFVPQEKLVPSSCCGAKICPNCVAKGRKTEDKAAEDGPIRCPEGKCPGQTKKKKKKKEGEKGGSSHCSCGIVCENEPLPNFPSEAECDHEVCLDCLGKGLEANENAKHVPCCPNEMCHTPYRSESVLALRVIFPERKAYFDMFEVGYHFGFEKLKDETVMEIEFTDDFDPSKRRVVIKVCCTEDEEAAVNIDFDSKGSFGDLLREARKALRIGITDKVYGYYMRLNGEDKVIVVTPDIVQQDLETAGVLQASMIMVDMNGIVSANKHSTSKKKK